MGKSPEAKVHSESKRTLGSDHENHKGTCLEPLDSQPGSGHKPRAGMRVPARDVKLPLHIGNTYQNIFITNFDNTVGCLKITEDKSLKSRVQTPNAGLIIAITAALRRQDARVKTRVSAVLQHQDARVETHVSVITALIMGLITAHIMRKLTPIMERF